jgi:malonyl CoA-acyl carrier protein transacylase/phosphopantetheinyl transferase
MAISRGELEKRQAEQAVTLAASWDAELFVLRGADRDDLVRRADTLNNFLSATSDVVLKDLAYSLNSALASGGSRLALVAGSMAELQARLTAAVQRLADPARAQIKDSLGIYYFDRPLYREGSLALLFPGEGAQYLNMLADLCPHFPEVKQSFDHGDRLADRASPADRPAFSRVFLVADNAPPEERAEAERALRELDHAMFSVLLADWAMFRLLSKLGLKPAAMAGHSMGEMAALGAAGCIDGDALVLEQIVAAMTVLLSRETTGELAAAVLLAVSAGKDVVGKIIGDQGGNVFLAMDNCPHQSVVVGPPPLMAAVEAELLARHILCERLPFDRPYHTPLFQPYLRTLHELFETLVFRAGGTPVYSCSTGRLFPSAPADIRRQAVEHYASPVEFTRLIETMHADGVRLFVESGPRGNLTSFVEDILRGKQFAALASNLPRRSGLAQLNHLAGQLAAHHVPLDLDHLYRRRDPKGVSWERAVTVLPVGPARDGNGHPAVSRGGASAPPSDMPLTVAPTAGRGAVAAQYLGVMEQFLEDQREIVEAYFLRRRGSEDRNRAVVALPRSGEDRPSPAAALPLLRSAEIVRLEAGKEVVVRRRLDLAEDLFALHHTVGGQAVSKVDPNQHGLPVMPMTFSLELMAEAGALLAPGLTVTSLKGIRLFRWLAFDEEEPTTIEVSARVLADAPREPGAMAQVAVEIRDLGSSAKPAAARGPAGLGVVLLAEQHPEAPPAGEFPLTNEHPPRIPVEVMYRNLFHGPLFQGGQPGGRVGDEGIEKEVVVLPRGQLFRSDPDPAFLADPVLLDVATHPMAAWHLEFPDQSGRILLPIELDKIDLFGPRPDVGARFTSRASILATSYRHFVHGVDVIGPDGKMWCRIHRLKYWRFYVPFAKVNFHGPKDEYFISREWKLALPSSPVPAACIRLDMPADQKQAAMRLVTAKVTLSPPEWDEFRAGAGHEQRQTEWLFGRLAAKDAVRVLWHARHGERLFPADIVIERDRHGRPVARARGPEGLEPFPTISLAHTEDVAAGLAAVAPHAGIDVERIRPRDSGFERIAFDDDERRLLDRLGPDRDEWLARFWCAKEAVAKALGRGLVDGSKAVAVRQVDRQTGVIKVALGPTLATIFPEWRADRIIAHTVRDDDLVVAISFCERDST